MSISTAKYIVIGFIHGYYIFTYAVLFGLLFSIYEFTVLLLLAIQSFRQKQRGKVLNTLAIIDIVRRIAIFVSALPYSLGVRPMLALSVYIALFIVSGKVNGDSAFPISDNVSEASRVQMQAKKQESIYDEQLRSGILTQEEYEQIMKKRS